MNQLLDPPFSYNLWTEPWISVKTLEGEDETWGIVDVLKKAHLLRSITAISPLEIAGIHRFLTAVLQAALSPKDFKDLGDIIGSAKFAPEPIDQFGKEYANRFDLFSPESPFFQSGDIPLKPEKGSPVKTIAYLFNEYPSGTGVVHYFHAYDDSHYICPACVARGLLIIPAFSSSGGAGIKPSINGVPPIYVLPNCTNLFESLAFSLTLPQFQPTSQTQCIDLPWWKHPEVVRKNDEIQEVGYLHSLTFPARRVRLFPVKRGRHCTRCGRMSAWGIEQMVFEMGESRPKGSPFWQDPFVTYSIREDKEPVPVRPSPGKVIWREYGSLFLKRGNAQADSKTHKTLRPRIIDQLDQLQNMTDADLSTLSFRCIGLRTDMKAKVFEWIDTGFDIPMALLQSDAAGLDVDDALNFASKCVSSLGGSCQDFLNRHKKGSRYIHLKNDLREQLWEYFSQPFRLFILGLLKVQSLPIAQQAAANRDVRLEWDETIVKSSLRLFNELLEQLGNDGHTLRLRSQVLGGAHRSLYGLLNKERNNHE